jgi:hypothetical protein
MTLRFELIRRKIFDFNNRSKVARARAILIEMAGTSPAMTTRGVNLIEKRYKLPARSKSHGRTIMKSSFVIATMSALLLPGVAGAAEIRVLSTQAPEEAYRELVPQFEKASGHKVTTVFTGTLDLQKRIAAGESYDLIIMAGPGIDDFI